MFCSVCLFLATAGIDFQRDQPDRTHTGNESNSSRADSPYRIGRGVQVSCRVAISAGVWLAKSSPRCREVGILDGSLKTRQGSRKREAPPFLASRRIKPSRSHRSFPTLGAPSFGRHRPWRQRDVVRYTPRIELRSDTVAESARICARCWSRSADCDGHQGLVSARASNGNACHCASASEDGCIQQFTG